MLSQCVTESTRCDESIGTSLGVSLCGCTAISRACFSPSATTALRVCKHPHGPGRVSKQGWKEVSLSPRPSRYMQFPPCIKLHSSARAAEPLWDQCGQPQHLDTRAVPCVHNRPVCRWHHHHHWAPWSPHSTQHSPGSSEQMGIEVVNSESQAANRTGQHTSLWKGDMTQCSPPSGK